jgi:hypothetical protein
MPKKTRLRAPSPDMTLRMSGRGAIGIGPFRRNMALYRPALLQNGHVFATLETIR